MESEAIHNQTLSALAWSAQSSLLRGLARGVYGAVDSPVEVFGLTFPNPVGLAAGMDKFAAALPMWECLGFGFCELGGVTRWPQPGNPQPRMFRAVEDRALVNRMGFNNPGSEAMQVTLKTWRERGLWPSHPVGINLGKSKMTPLEEAPEDYAGSLRLLRDYADFFVVNVSSPNTPGLRKLQGSEALGAILDRCQAELRDSDSTNPKPLLIKVAPELSWEAYEELIDLCLSKSVSGIVATNTTVERPVSSDSACQKTYAETGGLSGAPLRDRSTAVIRFLVESTQGRLPVIGVGGIRTASDVLEFIQSLLCIIFIV